MSLFTFSENMILSKYDLEERIEYLKRFYSKEVIEYLYSLLNLDEKGINADKVLGDLISSKDIRQIINYNFLERTKNTIENLGIKELEFIEGRTMFDGYVLSDLTFLDKVHADVYYFEEMDIDLLRRAKELLKNGGIDALQTEISIDQIPSRPYYRGHFYSENRDLETIKFDIDTEIAVHERMTSVYGDERFKIVPNALLEEYEMTNEKGKELKKVLPHAVISKYSK